MRRLFCAQVLFRSGKPSSKLRVPFVPNANVGTDDLSAQRRRSFCDMQRFIAVEGYGQICMGCTLGNLPGVRIDAAGQVYSKHKGTVLVQMAYQSAGSKAGRPQFTMESGAVEGIHNGSKALGFQYRTVSADVHRQGVQTLKIADGVSGFRLALGQKTVTFQPSFAAARAITNPSPPLLPFPQTTSSLPECGNCFCSSA